MTRVWMGWYDLDAALSSESIVLTGKKAYLSRARDWLGLSGLSSISKRPRDLRAGADTLSRFS